MGAGSVLFGCGLNTLAYLMGEKRFDRLVGRFYRSIGSGRIEKVLRAMEQQVVDKYARQSYSQEGEDLILENVFAGKRNGFYVDIGAHHPKRFSNTYNFYKRGWSGINVDAMPGSMRLFEKLRPRDINLELAVDLKVGIRPLYIYDEPALNTFDQELLFARERKGIYSQNKIMIKLQTLSKLLDEWLPKGGHIDFLSIDVEGLDLRVLKSNDWKRFRPFVVLVECLESTPKIYEEEVLSFMESVEYEFFAKSFRTIFFRNASQLTEELFR